jgi:hypothetical protein
VIERLKKENKKLRKENRLYNSNLRKLNSQVNEIKCLQMKSRYAIKLFERFNLSQSQKTKVIENFDRANNEREIKLVYATLAEGLKSVSKTPKKKKMGYASNRIKTTKRNIKESTLDDSDKAVSAIFRRRTILD